MTSVTRLAVIATILAGIACLGGIYGALACILIGAIAAEVAVRRRSDGDKTQWGGFRSWGIATASFAAFVIVLIPATWPAVTLGLLLFSPVFGTQAVMIEKALRHGRQSPE
jgi:hypothetical protein